MHLEYMVVVFWIALLFIIKPQPKAVRYVWGISGIISLSWQGNPPLQELRLENWMFFWILLGCFWHLSQSHAEPSPQNQDCLKISLWTIFAGTVFLLFHSAYHPSCSSVHIIAFGLSMFSITAFFLLLGQVVNFFQRFRHPMSHQISKFLLLIIMLSGILSMFAGPSISPIGCDRTCSPDPVLYDLVNEQTFPFPLFLHPILSHQHTPLRIPFLLFTVSWGLFFFQKRHGPKVSPEMKILME
ncbi:MAG: hypothetical protein WA705_00915 [Candidatus Ozemobacteraceae bacterium]